MTALFKGTYLYTAQAPFPWVNFPTAKNVAAVFSRASTLTYISRALGSPNSPYLHTYWGSNNTIRLCLSKKRCYFWMPVVCHAMCEQKAHSHYRSLHLHGQKSEKCLILVYVQKDWVSYWNRLLFTLVLWFTSLDGFFRIQSQPFLWLFLSFRVSIDRSFCITWERWKRSFRESRVSELAKKMFPSCLRHFAHLVSPFFLLSVRHSSIFRGERKKGTPFFFFTYVRVELSLGATRP